MRTWSSLSEPVGGNDIAESPMSSEGAGGTGLFWRRLDRDGLASLGVRVRRCWSKRVLQFYVDWWPRARGCPSWPVYEGLVLLLLVLQMTTQESSSSELVPKYIQTCLGDSSGQGEASPNTPSVQTHSFAFPPACDLRRRSATIPYFSR